MVKSLEIQISPTNPLWKTCDGICFKGKNLYNQANYIIRQYHCENQKWISSKDLHKLLINMDCYRDFGNTSISNQVFRDIIDIWSSYFNSLKAYKKSPDSFKSRPQIPKYKHKEKGRFQVCYTLSGTASGITPSYNKINILRFRGNQKFEIPVPNHIKDKKIKEILIVPKSSHYSIIINYDDIVQQQPIFDDKKFASIDLGINNLITSTTNFNKPFIINGRHIKSINQFYNK